MPIAERWCSSVLCCDPIWEDAYRRFETPDEEVRKFRRRLDAIGAPRWPRESRILEFCCGRGNGLRALTSLGFTELSGVDLSEDLLQTYDGPARLYLGDCRDLRLPSQSLDIVIVQGGLHHLPDLAVDLERTLAEVRRVLKPSGRFFVVEPWDTPFLRFVHVCSELPAFRRRWEKLDAFATMFERERKTYESWLGHSNVILSLLHRYFRVESERMAWGKLIFLGRPMPSGHSEERPLVRHEGGRFDSGTKGP
jgi:SAM-dependent methyltransferase